MMIGPMFKDPPAYLSLGGASVDRVATFKLLGFMCPVILSGQNMLTPSFPRKRHVCTSSNS